MQTVKNVWSKYDEFKEFGQIRLLVGLLQPPLCRLLLEVGFYSRTACIQMNTVTSLSCFQIEFSIHWSNAIE